MPPIVERPARYVESLADAIVGQFPVPVLQLHKFALVVVESGQYSGDSFVRLSQPLASLGRNQFDCLLKRRVAWGNCLVLDRHDRSPIAGFDNIGTQLLQLLLHPRVGIEFIFNKPQYLTLISFLSDIGHLLSTRYFAPASTTGYAAECASALASVPREDTSLNLFLR